jgi:hypothetical protein
MNEIDDDIYQKNGFRKVDFQSYNFFKKKQWTVKVAAF